MDEIDERYSGQAKKAAMAQIMAVSEANVAAAPVLARFCGAMLEELMKNGFTREEAMAIIVSSAKSK